MGLSLILRIYRYALFSKIFIYIEQTYSFILKKMDAHYLRTRAFEFKHRVLLPNNLFQFKQFPQYFIFDNYKDKI